MRSRERLIEALRSVNGNSIGINDSMVLHEIAVNLSEHMRPKDRQFKELERIADNHSSPHIQELAREAVIIICGLQPRLEI